MTRFHTRARANGVVEQIPFTLEEEAQRDAEETAWAAGATESQIRAREEEVRQARIAELKAKPSLSLREIEELVKLSVT
jgi:hypothetical protein